MAGLTMGGHSGICLDVAFVSLPALACANSAASYRNRERLYPSRRLCISLISPVRLAALVG